MENPNKNSKQNYGDVVTETIKNIDKTRGGRGSTGNPSEIKESIAEAQKEEVRIDHDLAKIKNDKDALLFTIADLRVKEAQAVEKGLRNETDAIRKEIIKAQKKIDEINGVLPETTASEDHKKVQGIINDWYAGKRDWRSEREKFQKAEKTLEKNPADGHAIGEALRARAKMQATNERLAEVAREAEVVTKNTVPNPAQDEGISYTAEQARNDIEERNMAKKVAPGIFRHTEETADMQEEMSVLAEEPTPIAVSETNDSQVTTNELQEKDGDNILYADFEHTEEARDANLPTLTEVVDEAVGMPLEEQESAFAKFESFAENEETRDKAIERWAALMNAQTEERAKKAGMSEGLLERVGEEWNKVPLSYKLLISAGMLTMGFSGALVAGTATTGVVAAIGLGMRGLSGAGMFAIFGKTFKNRAEKKGVERTGAEEFRDTALAAALSIIIVGVLPNVARDYAVEHGFFQKILDFFGGSHVEAETPQAPIETGEYIKTAGAGDSVWKMAAGIVGEKFPELSDEQQTYITDAIKDRIEKYPESFGIEGSDANNLAIGENVDFGGILNDKEFMDHALSSAQNLNAGEITNIQNYEALAPATPSETIPITDFIKEGFQGEEALHTDFTPPEQVIPTAEAIAVHANTVVEAGNLKGSFQYSPNGTVEGFRMEGRTSTEDASKLLNSNWQETLRGRVSASGASMDISVVSSNAVTVAGYEQMLNVLEQKGNGASPEAEFLKNSIDRIIGDIEKSYGDVFRNVEDFGKPEQVVPTSVVPQEILPALPKDVLMENYIPPMPSEITENPQALFLAEEQVHDIIKEVFGREGWFLGIGSSDGMETFKNFADKTVEEIMGINATEMPTGDAGKMQDLLNQAREQTHVKSVPGEKIADYLNRATAINIDRFMKNG